MVSAYKNAVQNNYANFEGRLSVPGFWWFWLANFIVVVVLFILMQIASLFVILYVVYALALIVPGLAAAVRRLHDSGKSGWLVLVSLIPLVGAIILIVFLASAGDSGANSYGPPPPPGA